LEISNLSIRIIESNLLVEFDSNESKGRRPPLLSQFLLAYPVSSNMLLTKFLRGFFMSAAVLAPLYINDVRALG